MEPVTKIFNASLASGIVPAIWKDTNIKTIPKTQFPKGDFRPISLTPCLCKLLEDFEVAWMIDDIRNKIDPNQTTTTTTKLYLHDYNYVVTVLQKL